MLKLIYAPDPILKKESVSIPQVDDHHRELIKQMYEVIRENKSKFISFSSR